MYQGLVLSPLQVEEPYFIQTDMYALRIVLLWGEVNACSV